MYFCDIDGTLTEQQKRWAKPIAENIARVKALIAAGVDVVIWSGTERYAREWCEANGFTGKHAPKHILGKPRFFIDNQSRVRPCKDGGGRILGRRRIITPEAFMEQTRDYEFE